MADPLLCTYIKSNGGAIDCNYCVFWFLLFFVLFVSLFIERCSETGLYWIYITYTVYLSECQSYNGILSVYNLICIWITDANGLLT